ncbi:MAG: glycosyltransferase family 4 protein [Gammaproteobacteria bacterium]|nr:glycosyltransferase family 4 protein [Gammaproteobacteria bacterium]
MRIVKLSTMDSSGGAARAALRLHNGLRAIGVDSHTVVQHKTVNDDSIHGPRGKMARLVSNTRLLIDQLPVIPHWHHSSDVFAPGWLSGNTWRRANALNPDIVHLHWITKAFLGIRDLARLNAPIVWTLHDMWAFTGGCHYDTGCGRYLQTCGSCPVLGSSRTRDLAHRLQSARLREWEGLDMTIVCPSRWLADCARNSAVLAGRHIEVIPNGINLQAYRPIEKTAARKHLSITTDDRLILFGAMGPTENARKGFSQLQSGLQHLAASGWDKHTRVIVFGTTESTQLPLSGFPVQHIPQLQRDEDLAALYSAADVFVAPSLQDNLPNTVMEALACGTPCVAFNIGGMPDLIEHKENGYLATPRDNESLARGIAWVLEDLPRWQQLSRQARAFTQDHFDLAVVAKQYKQLYSDILEQR